LSENEKIEEAIAFLKGHSYEFNEKKVVLDCIYLSKRRNRDGDVVYAIHKTKQKRKSAWKQSVMLNLNKLDFKPNY